MRLGGEDNSLRENPHKCYCKSLALLQHQTTGLKALVVQPTTSEINMKHEIQSSFDFKHGCEKIENICWEMLPPSYRVYVFMSRLTHFWKTSLTSGLTWNSKWISISAVQTPGFSPPAPAPVEKFRFREKNSGPSRKFQVSVNLSILKI